MLRPALVENGAIGLACVLLGLMAGFFCTYTFNVNPALLKVDGPTYAIVQSLLNQNVRHAAFFVCFFGAGVAPIAAAVVNFKHWKEASVWLVAVAGIAYIAGVVVFTREVNLPLNAYTESWTPSNVPTDWDATRNKWNEASAIRVYVSPFSLVCCLVALVLRASGRREVNPSIEATS